MLFTIFFLCLYVIVHIPLMSGQPIIGENCRKGDKYEVLVKMKELYLGFKQLERMEKELQKSNRRLAEIENSLLKSTNRLILAEQRIDRLGKLCAHICHKIPRQNVLACPLSNYMFSKQYN